MDSSITQLIALISSTASALDVVCSQNDLHIPHLNEPLTGNDEEFRSHPEAAKLANVIASAAFELIATLLPPQEYIFQLATGHLKSAAFRVALDCNVAEVLREAGPEGLSVGKIAEKSGVDSAKLARLLRYLANRHIFREVSPDVFTNNKISGMMDSGKSADENLQNPEAKHEGTSGFLAFSEHCADEAHKCSAYLLENMKDPMTAHSDKETHAPFHRVFQTSMTYWEWCVQPAQSYQRGRFAVAMKGNTVFEPHNLLFEGFDWKFLPNNAVVVDVGGGIGTTAMSVIRRHPEFRVVVQDTPSVLEEAKKFWAPDYSVEIAAGKVQFQAHDFFTAQPVEDASVFVLKHILHDWPDALCIKILSHLRQAANADTKLIILEVIIPYLCNTSAAGSTPDLESDFGLGNNIVVPGLSLPNFGAANELCYSVDLLMLVYLNSQERTLPQFRNILLKSGWRIVKVVQDRHTLDYLEASPV